MEFSISRGEIIHFEMSSPTRMRKPSLGECKNKRISEKARGLADLTDLFLLCLSIVTCNCMRQIHRVVVHFLGKSDIVGQNLVEDIAQTKPQIKPKSSQTMQMLHTNGNFHTCFSRARQTPNITGFLRQIDGLI